MVNNSYVSHASFLMMMMMQNHFNFRYIIKFLYNYHLLYFHNKTQTTTSSCRNTFANTFYIDFQAEAVRGWTLEGWQV